MSEIESHDPDPEIQSLIDALRPSDRLNLSLVATTTNGARKSPWRAGFAGEGVLTPLCEP